MTGRQRKTVRVVGDLRPHHARGVGEGHGRRQIQHLLALGYRRLIAHLGHALLEQRIHQRGFAHVGNAHDHHAQRLEAVGAVGRQGLAQVGHLGHVAGLLARQGHRLHAFLGIVVGQPLGGDDRIGQIGLVENLQTRPLAMGAQVANHRVAARLGQAGIEHFDDDVDTLHALRRLLAGGSHVTGEPLDGHGRALNQ